jgi:ABC-type dipeptide/oligopeptide/nickel transport system ATPase component
MTGHTKLVEADLTIHYAAHRVVVDQVRLDIGRGEVVGLIGASGSGKSTIGLALMRLLSFRGARVTGAVRFDGIDLLHLPEREMRRLRGRRISLILQSAQAALNPALRLERHFREAWLTHASVSWERGRERVSALLASIGLPGEPAFLAAFPHQISAGQAQRVLIALAVMHEPELLIADEPTSALDAITQAEVIALLSRLHRERGTAILFISHDLQSVASFCHRVLILDGGRIVEQGDVGTIFRSPAHPFTRRLVGAAAALSPALQLPDLARAVSSEPAGASVRSPH